MQALAPEVSSLTAWVGEKRRECMASVGVSGEKSVQCGPCFGRSAPCQAITLGVSLWSADLDDFGGRFRGGTEVGAGIALGDGLTDGTESHSEFVDRCVELGVLGLLP